MTASGRNDPCPCGSGKKFKKCCALITPSSAAPQTLQQAVYEFNLAHFSEAEAICLGLLRHQPKDAKTWLLLGLAQFQQSRYDDAIQSVESSCRLDPTADSYYNLGVIQQAKGDLAAATAAYQQAQRISPNAKTLSNLGSVHHLKKEWDEALSCYLAALQLTPNDAGLLSNIGLVLQTIGQVELAIDHLRASLAINPDFAEAHSSLIYCLDLAPSADLTTQMAERQAWNARHAAHITPDLRHANSAESERRLRIGYVSADFRNHSAVTVFGAMLRAYDHNAFDVVAYSNSSIQDEVTARIKLGVTLWRDIYGLSDTAVCEQIRADGIDILVDLSGHSQNNRLLVFARKPAPIQITAWGYASSTGLHTMDAFLVDEIVVPPEEKTAYQESIRYLPNLFSADFPYRFPDTTSLPALQNGYLTFGVFTRLNKTSSLTFELWAALLKALPTSQLLFKAPELDAPGVRSHVEQTFVSLGVAPERLTLMGSSSWAEHMATMLQADIALDPFPHGGGVTTMEMLNLGIPVLTLVHPTIAGRLSATLLNSLGLNDWVTTSPEEYLQHALRLDKDKEGLATLRRSLRERFSKSVLADHAGYLRAVEHEYRALWRDWCTSQKAL